jgi:hypothetical protein
MARPRASARPWAAAFAVALLLAGGEKHKIVYQLDDAGVDKTLFVLNNIGNHVDGGGGEYGGAGAGGIRAGAAELRDQGHGLRDQALAR